MSTELKMTINERYKYLHMMQVRYRQANKPERSRLLDEMEMMTGCHRKSLIRQMKSDLRRKKRRKQRGRIYGVELHAALKVIRRESNIVFIYSLIVVHQYIVY